MKEIDLQSKCIAAIRELGGFSQKMSNRFLIGVPDLLCQLPDFPTSFWEVKRRATVYQNPDPSPKQKLWLRDFTRAGGFCGVIYFVASTKINEMLFAVRPSSVFDLDDLKKPWRVDEDDFRTLPRGSKFAPFKEEIMRVHEDRRNAG